MRHSGKAGTADPAASARNQRVIRVAAHLEDMTDAHARNGDHKQAEASRPEGSARSGRATRRERQHVEILSAILRGQTSHALGLAFEHLDEFGVDQPVVEMLSAAVAERHDAALSLEFDMFLRRVREKRSGAPGGVEREGTPSLSSVPDFATFDRRRYRTVSAREGYAAWQPTYDDVVEDIMDLAVLERLTSVPWTGARSVADLGCGTGRTAMWLAGRGVASIDGVDLTPEMLDVARGRGLHRRLIVGDVRATTLSSGGYDLVVCSLVDEHLRELGGLYREARRLLRTGGLFVLVGYHPYFIMASGMPTHFDGADDEPVAIETYVHLPSEHVTEANNAGFVAVELVEAVIDDEWIKRKPKWQEYRDWPISFAWVWRATPSS
jgi:SAM-dependent methyltransferase